MSRPSPFDAEAFLEFASAQIAAGEGEFTPEELLTRWRKEHPTNAKPRQGAGSALEDLQQAGLLGCIDTGVGDLSTNKSHLEGLGSS